MVARPAGVDSRDREAVSRRLGQFSCRKRYIDDQLVSAVAKGVDAVVILGAGYDTRPYRFPELAGIPVCEVDLPTIIARKAAGRSPPPRRRCSPALSAGRLNASASCRPARLSGWDSF
jgi:methyltransferase (TIGR00027 family)